MAYTAEQQDALRDLENAAKAIRGGKSITSEAAYGAAYRRCVALGVKPKLKSKYNN